MVTQQLANNAVDFLVMGSLLEERHVVEVYPMETRPDCVWVCDGRQHSVAAQSSPIGSTIP
jgi:hypothetical protein